MYVERIDVYQRITVFNLFVKNKGQILFQIAEKHVLEMTVNPRKKKKEKVNFDASLY